MSRVVDDRVVSLQFDNSKFEKNVSTTMSTLDKLKQKLNIQASSKAFDNIGAAAKKVDLTGISAGVEALKVKFSALDVMAVTALGNITNAAMRTATNMAKALTIDPIMTGFREYETQMGSIQTILANTQSKGSTLQDVTKALDELNTYADKTIYNFTEMTRNIGMFTAAGVDLDKSVTSIKGIANLAAISGSTSQQASTAMYQLSQALATGKVSLMDWNSVVNAGMGGEVFQTALKRTATQMGHNVDALIEKYGSFRESLTQGNWLTAEVLTETLTQLSGAYSEADLIAQGYTEKQAKEIIQLAKTAESAATDVKTFTQLFDTLKEAAGSGWAQTWKIIFGDFEEAKALFSTIHKAISPIIEESAKARNALLTNVFDSKWSKLSKEVEKAGVDVSEFQKELINTAKSHGVNVDKMIEKNGSFEKSLKEGWASGDIVIETLKRMGSATVEYSDNTDALNEKLKTFQNVVDKVWKGDFKNGAERIEALTKAGYDYAKVQELVNKTVDGHKLTLEDLGEEQLKAVGYTEKEIEAIRELASEAEKAGTPLNELINSLSKPSGKELFFDSFANLFEAISKPLKAIKEAWNEIFPDEKKEQILYGLIEGFNKLTESLIISDESAGNLKTVFEGLFAGFNLATSVVSMSFVGGLKILNAVLQLFGTNLLEVAAMIAEYVIKVADWIESNTLLMGTFDKIGTILAAVIKGISECINAFKELDVVKDIFESVSGAVDNFFKSLDMSGFTGNGVDTFVKIIEQFFNKLKNSISEFNGTEMSENIKKMFGDFKENIATALSSLGDIDLVEIGLNVIEGFKIGLQEGVGALWQGVVDIATKVIEAAKAVLGINSPSTVFMAIGGFVIAGLVLGIQNGIPELGEVFSEIIDYIKNFFSGINFTDVALIGGLISMVFLTNKAIDTLDKFASPLEGLGNVFDSIGGVFNSLSNFIDVKKTAVKADAMLSIAKAIGILAASVALLAMLDPGKLLGATAAIVALGGALFGLSFATKYLGDIQGFGKLSLFLLSFGATLLLISSAIKKVAKLDPAKAGAAFAELAALISIFGIIMYAIAKLPASPGMNNIDKFAVAMIEMAGALIVISLAIKVLAGISPGDAFKGVVVIGAIAAIFGVMGSLMNTTKGGNLDKAGAMFVKLGIAIGLLAVAMKIIATIQPQDIVKGLAVIAGISTVFYALGKLSIGNGKYKGSNMSKFGTMMLKMATSMILLGAAIKLLASISLGDVIQGLAIITVCSLLFKAMGKVMQGGSEFDGANASKFGTMMIKMAVAMGLMGIVIKLLATLSLGEVVKGVAVVAACELLFAAIIKVSKFTGPDADKAGSLILKMSLAIGALVIVMRLMRDLTVSDILKGIAFVGACTVLFSAIVAVSKFAGEHADKAGAMLTKMVAPIVALAAAIALLSFLDPNRVAIAAASMTAAVSAFALMIKATTALKGTKGMLGPILTLTVVVGALASIIALMSGLDPTSALGNAATLSVLLASFSLALFALGTVVHVSKSAMMAMGILTGVVAGLAVILGILEGLNVDLSIPNAIALSTLLIAMSAVTSHLGVIGMFGAQAAIGALVLGETMLVVAGVIAIIIEVCGLMAKQGDFIIDGLDMLVLISEKIGAAIGGFVGNIVSGAGEGIADTIVAIGKALGAFGESTANIDPNAMTGVKSVAEALTDIAKAGFIETISSLFGGGNSMESFSEQLPAFGSALKGFSDSIEGINPDNMTAAANAAKSLAELNNSINGIGALISTLTGTDLSTFGTQLESFGVSLVRYCSAVTGEDFDTEAITASAEAAKALAEVSNSVTGLEALVSWITGRDLSTFGTQLESFGTSLAVYCGAISGQDFNTEAITASAEAAKALAQLSNDYVNLDTFISWITGRDLSTFGAQLESFGTSLAAYCASVSGGNIDAGKITASVNAAKTLVNLANDMPDKDGWLNGSMSLSTFGKAIEPLGTSLANYSSSVASVDTAKVDATASSMKTLTTAIKGMSGIDTAGATNFVSSVNTLAGANISGLVAAFEGQTGSLEAVGLSLASAIESGLLSGESAVSGAAETIASAAAKAAEGKSSEFKSAGEKLISELKKALDDGKESVKTAAGGIASAAATAISEYSDDFYNAGAACAQGLASGLSDNAYIAIAAAQVMADSVAGMVKSALQVNSPSKVLRRIGKSVPEGFAQGISMMGNVVNRATLQMTNKVVRKTSDAVSMISEAIAMDVDAQPTIRPVVDLDNVYAGARAINESLALNPSVGVMSNIRSISFDMNTRNQNGVNDDVVNAIRKLDKTIRDNPSVVNNINGITYDDGSNIVDAVATLVRAAKVDRRS